MKKLSRYEMEIDWYWDYGYDDESSKTYYVKENKCENGRWILDEEVAELEKLYEELIRHAAELELENMLLKNNKEISSER